MKNSMLNGKERNINTDDGVRSDKVLNKKVVGSKYKCSFILNWRQTGIFQIFNMMRYERICFHFFFLYFEISNPRQLTQFVTDVFVIRSFSFALLLLLLLLSLFFILLQTKFS